MEGQRPDLSGAEARLQGVADCVADEVQAEDGDQEGGSGPNTIHGACCT